MPEKLTNRIRPARAITPSITNTLNKTKTRKSERTTEASTVDDRNRRKNVIISNRSNVISSHSERTRKAKDSTNQTESTFKNSVGGPGVLSTEK